MRIELLLHLVFYLFLHVVHSRGYRSKKSDRVTMTGRSSRYNFSDVLELLDDENLDDFGLAESEDSDCEGGEVGSYLPEVQLDVEDPFHSVEDTLGMDSDPGPGKSTDIALVVLVDSEKL